MSEDEERTTLLPPPIEDLSVLIKAAEAQLTPAQREMQELGSSTNTEQSERARLSRRPYVRHLEAAVTPEGELIARVGETVIVDRRCTLLPGVPWLDTRQLVIKQHWPEEKRVRGFCEAMKHYVTFGYAPEHKTEVFMLPKKGVDPFKVPSSHRKHLDAFMEETLSSLNGSPEGAREGTGTANELGLPEGKRPRKRRARRMRKG